MIGQSNIPARAVADAILGSWDIVRARQLGWRPFLSEGVPSVTVEQAYVILEGEPVGDEYRGLHGAISPILRRVLALTGARMTVHVIDDRVQVWRSLVVMSERDQSRFCVTEALGASAELRGVVSVDEERA